MAGHSKWANIKYKKERADAKRGKVFSRIAKEIISAVKVGGSADPKANSRLRLALQKAREANTPNDIIERNIKKGSSVDQSDFSEITYEIYGHGGVGLLVEIMTDNKNRISGDMRIATNKRGGSIAGPGSVAFNFEQKGVIEISNEPAIDEETLFHAASDAGAEDFELEENIFMITTRPEDLFKVKESLEELGFKAVEASLEMLPKVTVSCDSEAARANLALIEWLEALDDVDYVYHNMELPEEA